MCIRDRFMTVLLGAVRNCFLTYLELSGCYFSSYSARILKYLHIFGNCYIPSADLFFFNRENILTSLISPLKLNFTNFLKHSSFLGSFKPVDTSHMMQKMNRDGIFQLRRLKGLPSVIFLVFSFYILV